MRESREEAAAGFADGFPALPQTTAKQELQREKRLPQTTAKPPAARSFAVVDDLISDADLSDDLSLFAAAALDRREWRIERRYRTRQDGQRIMYYNFRRRRIKRVDGKQRVEYLAGGRYNVAS